LVRVPDLQAMHDAISRIACSGDPLEVRERVVIVPTRGAADVLRRTLEKLLLADGGAIILPDLLTRNDFYVRLHQLLPDAPPLLSDFEREVIFRRAARVASEEGAPSPFKLRPGLIAEILSFYDELCRRERTVDDFERLITGSLEPSVAIDRGAERMLRQTRFLTSAFREFERRVLESGQIDEHRLRRLLLESPCPFRHVILAVADQAADSRGLWASDFDLLARAPGVERFDVIATENLLGAGFLERVHDLLPGLEEERWGQPAPHPAVLAPGSNGAEVTTRWFTSRDREEEIAHFARLVKGAPALEGMALVFQRPLPYLYLARQVFADAQVPYQAVDAFPLAAEPFAAALDLIFTLASAEGTRASLIELLGSPHWRFEGEGHAVNRGDIAALDTSLRDLKYMGGWDRLAELAAASKSPPAGSRSPGASRALQAAADAAGELRAAMAATTASEQLRNLLDFIGKHERAPSGADAAFARHYRARAAILGAIHQLAEAHARHDDEPLSVIELAGTIRRWIERHTFSPWTGSGGVMLLDVPAAAFADVNAARLVGLVETDWPESARRSIFYPAALLSQLGWPNERDRRAAARARFQDLLRLPRSAVSVSTFTFEDDAIVAASPFLEDLNAIPAPIERLVLPNRRIFIHEALAEEPVIDSAVGPPVSEWLLLRRSRSDPAAHDPAAVSGTGRPAVNAVSHLERYLECPFKYFARHVLHLDEERGDESGLTPQERGQFLHEVFESFFNAWQASGGRVITPRNLERALSLFEQVAEAHLATLSESDRALERSYLLGSAVAAGLAERAFAFEIDHDVEVLERLLEYPLEGEFEFRGEQGTRRLRVRAKADRIDLLADGTLRVVDYKLGKAPKPSRVLQLPIYGVCAEQHLEGRHGRSWVLSKAGYVAFREKNAFVALGGSGSLQRALAEGQQRLLMAVASIERGEFPVDPEEPFLCTRCGYTGVCRKDYVGDE
jgi:hypothetical protein